jgi:hypothetical protein
MRQRSEIWMASRVKFQHGHAGRQGKTAVVLLVLAGRHAWVVRRNDDQAAGHAGVRHGEQGVRCHVQAHVLHGDQGARTSKGGADADLQSDLLVGRPLRPSPERVEGLKDLGGRRAWIPGAERDAGVKSGLRNGFVAARESAIGIVLGHKTSASRR